MSIISEYRNSRGADGRPPRSYDEYFTPPEAIDILKPFLKKDWIYYEPVARFGSGIADRLEYIGYKVIRGKQIDYLQERDIIVKNQYDCLITNPPFKFKNDFIAKFIQIGKPFFILLPIDALGSVERVEMWKSINLQMIIPDSRIHYLGKNNKGASWFHSCWYCRKIFEKDQYPFQFVSLPKVARNDKDFVDGGLEKNLLF